MKHLYKLPAFMAGSFSCTLEKADFTAVYAVLSTYNLGLSLAYEMSYKTVIFISLIVFFIFSSSHSAYMFLRL